MSSLSSAMYITALAIAMGKIAFPGAELLRAVTVLQEHCPAVEALNRGQILANHLLRMF